MLRSSLVLWGLPSSLHKFVDTHCHLDKILHRSLSSLSSLEQYIVNNFNAIDTKCVFGGCVSVACCTQEMAVLESIINQPFAKENNIRGSIGIHPHNAKTWIDEGPGATEVIMRAIVERGRKDGSIVSIGECGLDYFVKPSCSELLSAKEIQQKVFIRQIRLAGELGMPLVVHTRNALEDTYRLLTENVADISTQRIHVHCYTEGPWFPERVLATFPNAFFGFTGCITFPGKRSEALRRVVRDIPLPRILLETDGPYMAPVPYRGNVAHCGHIPVVGCEIARIHGVSQGSALAQCSANAHRMYGI